MSDLIESQTGWVGTDISFMLLDIVKQVVITILHHEW